MGSGARIVVYAAAALALAFIGLTIAFFAVNTGDEELSAEAVRMLKAPENPYPPEQNLYVALAGLDAPRGASTVAEGLKKIAAYDRIAALPGKQRRAAYEAMESERTAALRFAGRHDCLPAVKSCWSAVAGRRSDHRDLLKANAELYRRYLELHATRAFIDTAEPSVWAQSVYAPPPLRSLVIEDLALRVKDGRARERSAALGVLDRDIRTWRAMLTGQGTIVSKFVALYNLHGDYALLSDIVGDAHLELSPHLAEIESMIVHMAPGDWKIGGALDYEFRMIAAVLDDLAREQNPFMEARPPGEPAPWWQSLVPGDMSAYSRPEEDRQDFFKR